MRGAPTPGTARDAPRDIIAGPSLIAVVATQPAAHEGLANANLIAAAPDLLAALLAYVEADDEGYRCGTLVNRTARSAIARARGLPHLMEEFGQ